MVAKWTFESMIDENDEPVRVRLGDLVRWYPPGRTLATVTDPDLEVDVNVAIHADETGVRCTDVRFTSAEGSVGIDVRLPTARQVRRIVAQALTNTSYFSGPHTDPQPAPTDPAALRTWLRQMGADMDEFEAQTFRSALPRRRNARTPTLYREVARVYNEANADGVSPRARIKAALDIRSPHTVRNLIADARRRIDPDTGQPYLAPAAQLHDRT